MRSPPRPWASTCPEAQDALLLHFQQLLRRNRRRAARHVLQINAHAKPYTTAMTYEILLIVVIGGIGSITGSACIGTFLYVACAASGGCAGLDNAQFHDRHL